MTSTFMAQVLLGQPIRLTHDSIVAALATLPDVVSAELIQVDAAGENAAIQIGDTKCAVTLMNEAAPAMAFGNELQRPGSEDLAALVDAHTAQLVVLAHLTNSDMDQSVMAASAVHLLSVHLANAWSPLAGFWMASKRLSDWETFCADAEPAADAFASDDPVPFPARFWVSVQLTGRERAFGAQTLGLKPFTGYEIAMTPVDRPMEFVADRMLGTVQYIFEAGPVLEDGQTLGASHFEHFQISRPKNSDTMRLDLMEGRPVQKGASDE